MRDQARQLRVSTRETSRRRGSLDLPAGWWLERDPAKRAELERIVAALPAIDDDVCPVCAGHGWVRGGYRGAPSVGIRINGMPPLVRDVERCPECYRPDPHALLDFAAIPKQYRHATFETFALLPGKTDGAHQVREWADAGAPGSLLLRGGPGRGKTHLAVAAARVLIERGIACRFVQAAALLDDLKASIPTDSTAAVESRYRSARVLVLDDIGAARPTEWARDRISALIEARMNNEAPTLITSDKNAEELIRMGYDERMVSRLRTYTVVQVGGDDMRGRKART